ncbi:MAG: sigma-54-dependent Fis family transcriptional regulator, partial [Isosphaeraceae bacterium]|nr:sigma-54-dependent Fis family transcriptional regulator [Isosphaeraceae bacterium]
MKRRILVVDDTPLNREHLRAILQQDDLMVDVAEDGRSALERLRSQHHQLLITDLCMPDMSGLELLAVVRSERLPCGVIVLTAYGDTQIALDAMKAGADDFVTKPYEPDRLRFLVARILERRRLIDELEDLRLQMREGYSFHNMVSKSPKMRRVFDLIEQVGPLGSTVLIHGETGTGKELVAQALHAASRRRGAFIALNCAALNANLLESELFGHEKGAFSDAYQRKKGRFELADGGTLFLDEIGDLPAAMQTKLLRVLQSGQFERVGGTETIKVDVRIIGASHRRLEDEVRTGRFRSDLFYRLNVLQIDLPPLRERREDIPLLAMHFLDRLRTKSSPPVTEIHPEAMQALMNHTWPGNVRELENAITAAVALADGSVIQAESLPLTIVPRPERRPGNAHLIDIDRPLPNVTEELIGLVERD